MNGKCSRWKQCQAYTQVGCEGCSFQHFERILIRILENCPNKQTFEFLGDKFFELCSQHRQGSGGRITLDRPIKELLTQQIPELEELPPDHLLVDLTINNKPVLLRIKCDMAFQYHGKYIFCEVKGYGEDTNSILSAITAAQLIKEIPKYQKDSYYYYIGVSGNNTQDAFHCQKRPEITPYVEWAESRGFLKFYSIVDINQLIEEITNL